MKPPRRVPLVDREVRTWTENISDAAVADLTTALFRRVGKIDRRYDIPSIAGSHVAHVHGNSPCRTS